MTATDGPATYELYGLRVRSELPLAGARPTVHAGGVDLTITVSAPAPVPREVPHGEVLALWRSPEAFWHGVVRDEVGVRFRVPEVADYLLTDAPSPPDGRDPSDRDTLEPPSADTDEPPTDATDATVGDLRRHPHRHVLVTPASEDQLGLTEVLASGALFAVLFELAGTPILHAGAVEVDGRAVAVVGSSGRGKSTTSALLCRSGLPLVTDDLLRLEPDGDVVRCARGTTSLRMRDKAHALVASFGGHDDTSPDGRLLLNPTPTSHDHLPLAALVFPIPTRDGSGQVEVRRLSTAECFDELLASPRFLGWEHPEVLTRLFATASELARRVPAYAVQVSWTETFPERVVDQLGARVRAIAGG